MNRIIDQKLQKTSKHQSCWVWHSSFGCKQLRPKGKGVSVESLVGMKWDNVDQCPAADQLLLPLGRCWTAPGWVSCPQGCSCLSSLAGHFFLLTVPRNLLGSEAAFLCLMQELTSWGRFLVLLFLQLFLSRCQQAFLLGLQAVASLKADVMVLSLKIADSLSDTMYWL